MRYGFYCVLALSGAAMLAATARADTVIYNNLTPNNLMAIATRPESTGKFEIEAGDDFVVAGGEARVNSASFTGLIVPGSGAPTISDVVVEIYRVFPADSDVGRTSGPPTFSTPQVPTRVNSPSDVAFATRDSASGLTFTTSQLSASFTALNSVTPGGIHPMPNQTTMGNGQLTGQEVQFNVTFTTPFDLPADHYFFVPQVEVDDGGNFYWLSADRPITGANGTTPFPMGVTDLQAWTRDAMLDPDWLRVGTDIVDGAAPVPTFNTAFELFGTVPEPSTVVLTVTGVLALIGIRRRSVL